MRLPPETRRGLSPGDYVVTVVATAAAADLKQDIAGKLLTPLRYGRVDQSGLRFTVQTWSQQDRPAAALQVADLWENAFTPPVPVKPGPPPVGSTQTRR